MTGASTARVRRPTVAVWKFASCDGCQLTVLDGEEDLLTVAGAVRFAHFRELSSRTDPGPYDLSLVEGSIASRTDAERIRQIRQLSRRLVAIGACATAGGIQSLRNFAADGAYPPLVYAHPEYLDSLDTVTPISAHVDVDLELHGCPIDPGQLLEVVTATLAGRKAVLPGGSVCQQCKAAGTVCLTVRDDVACLGPATRAGCGGLCPAYGRGCYGCFGPAEGANVPGLTRQLVARGADRVHLGRLLRAFTAAAPAFAEASAAELAAPRADHNTAAPRADHNTAAPRADHNTAAPPADTGPGVQ